MYLLSLPELVEKTKKLKVLYVEDNQESRLQFIKILNNFFNYIDSCVDGLEGLNKYKEKGPSFYDLVISDMSMPELSGSEMSKAILEINHHQNIIIVSAYNDSEQLEELIDIGIDNYIHKPVNMYTLIRAMNKIMGSMSLKDEEDEEFNKIKNLNHELDVLVSSFDTYVIASRTDLKGKITYASKAYETISGYKESELLGRPHSIVRHPDMPKSAFKDMWETIQSGRLWVGEVKNLRKDGSYYWVHASIAPYYDKNNKHIGYSAIRIDITAQKEVEVLHNQVKNLLDNVAQGFLSFNKNMEIEKSFSKECLQIFNKTSNGSIYGENIANLLFGNDAVKKDLFEDAISRVTVTDDQMAQELFLSLLPQEHFVYGKDIKIEYKLLQEKKFMLVLTDITHTKKLEKQIEQQNQIQKMIVAVVSHKNDFIDLKYEFENFILNPMKDMQILLRELHTYKGVFAQKEMLNIVYGIHALETKINEILQKNVPDVEHIIEIFQAYNLQSIFDKDINIIVSILGDEFLCKSCSISVDIDAIESLESKIRELEEHENNEALKTILNDFEKFKYESVYNLLQIYPSAVKKMALKLEKEIYPLEIVGDRNITLPERFKPFMKSLIHIFNNCVEHGIEDTEAREESQKSEIGTVFCNYAIDDGIFKIVIGDDGVGINVEYLTSRALQEALITSKELALMSEDEKLMLVFANNLTTKETLSTTSGRGVGMSVIKSYVDILQGDIKIINKVNKGIEFTFLLPIDRYEESLC